MCNLACQESERTRLVGDECMFLVSWSGSVVSSLPFCQRKLPVESMPAGGNLLCFWMRSGERGTVTQLAVFGG